MRVVLDLNEVVKGNINAANKANPIYNSKITKNDNKFNKYLNDKSKGASSAFETKNSSND